MYDNREVISMCIFWCSFFLLAKLHSSIHRFLDASLSFWIYLILARWSSLTFKPTKILDGILFKPGTYYLCSFDLIIHFQSKPTSQGEIGVMVKWKDDRTMSDALNSMKERKSAPIINKSVRISAQWQIPLVLLEGEKYTILSWRIPETTCLVVLLQSQ